MLAPASLLGHFLVRGERSGEAIYYPIGGQIEENNNNNNNNNSNNNNNNNNNNKKKKKKKTKKIITVFKGMPTY